MRSMVAQGKPGACWLRRRLSRAGLVAMLLMALLAAPMAQAQPPCQRLPMQALAPGLWLLPAAGGDSDASNRGHTSHLLLARDGPRLWAIGTGPTPAFGQRLRCTALQRLGRTPTDALVPWAHAELALGAHGLAAPRLWAHAQVAEAMAEQCPTCVDRLRQRLGAAAIDLGDDPVRAPTRLLHGAAGRVGPFDWWVLPRAQGRVVTVLRHRASGVAMAHGLLWGDGPPDTRDADLPLLQAALQQLVALAPVPSRWVGESGPLLDGAGVAAQRDYLQDLRRAAADGVRQGLVDQPPPALPGAAHPRHALNWQRAWRQAETPGCAATSRRRPARGGAASGVTSSAACGRWCCG